VDSLALGPLDFFFFFFQERPYRTIEKKMLRTTHNLISFRQGLVPPLLSRTCSSRWVCAWVYGVCVCVEREREVFMGVFQELLNNKWTVKKSLCFSFFSFFLLLSTIQNLLFSWSGPKQYEVILLEIVFFNQRDVASLLIFSFYSLSPFLLLLSSERGGFRRCHIGPQWSSDDAARRYVLD